MDGHAEQEEHVKKGAMKMNNPFGIPDEVFNTILSSAIKQSMTQNIKKPNPDAKKKESVADGAKALKQLYDAYVEVGFSDTQAFDLLKTILS
jgi:hypothetical protein